MSVLFTGGIENTNVDIGDNIVNSIVLSGGYLSRTFGSPTNNKKYSLCIKLQRANISSAMTILAASPSTAEQFFINSADKLNFYTNDRTDGDIFSTGVHRGTAKYKTILLVFDSANATSGNRCLIYDNGVLVSTVTTAITLNQASQINVNSAVVNLGRYPTGGLNLFDGYICEVYFVDGQALAPSDFGRTSADTGEYVNKAYTGTYGNNGFHLDFKNSASLGTDVSGNGNNWTLNSITSANQTTSTPTNTYCVLDPLKVGHDTGTFSGGNLTSRSGTGGGSPVWGTFAIPSSGKWYFECKASDLTANLAVGIASYYSAANFIDGNTNSVGYASSNGHKYVDAADTSYGASYTTSDTIGILVDADNGTITFNKNNSSQGTITHAVAGLFPAASDEGGVTQSTYTFNFGATAFTYTPPAGYKALCTANLPTPAIVKPSKYFDAVGWVGSNATRTISLPNPALDVGLVWNKNRSSAQDHKLTDKVRGVTKALITDTSGAQTTDANGVTAFAQGSFNLGTGTRNYNDSNADNFVAWCWALGGAAASNTDGSITSSVSANITSGVSVGTYTGNTTAGATVGHGLGKALTFVIDKDTVNANNWGVGHQGLTSWAYNLYLASNAAQANADNIWNSTAPSSSVITLGSHVAVNSAALHVFIAFAEIAGFSKFGSYIGNNSADGTLVQLNFRPRWILIKDRDQVGNWTIFDTLRDTYNAVGDFLYGNTAAAGTSSPPQIDIISNGFKVRVNNAGSAMNNVSGNVYIFAAFAECPFKYANER